MISNFGAVVDALIEGYIGPDECRLFDSEFQSSKGKHGSDDLHICRSRLRDGRALDAAFYEIKSRTLTSRFSARCTQSRVHIVLAHVKFNRINARTYPVQEYFRVDDSLASRMKMRVPTI